MRRDSFGREAKEGYPMTPRRLLALVVASLALAFALDGLADRFTPCPEGLTMSPYSHVCSAEGTDDWFGAP